MKFTKEEVRQLIESINVGSINESEMDVLAEDTMKKLNESFDAEFERGKAEGIKESTENIRKERLESFQKGQEKGKSTIEEAVKKAEELAFKAGKTQGIVESEEKEEEISKDLLDLIEQLCIVFDKYTRLVEIVTHENTKEEFKESVKEQLIKFCDSRVNESIDEKMVVDYHRLQQLESLNESIKKMYLINDIDVSEAVKEARESCAKEFNEAKEAAAEQTKRRIAAEQLLESVKAENLLLKKVQSLPIADQKQLMESFKGASVEAINESFDREHQKIVERRASTQRPVINDMLCESRLNKIREAQQKQILESTKKETVNESVDDTTKTAVTSKMNQYAKICQMYQKHGL